PASYTNYGTSQVEFSAPGGGYDYPGNEGCVVAGIARPCWVFDLVFSTGNGAWYWSGGTSMAAPHAAGVAALIISENGGDMKPAQVEAQMRMRGIDLGKPGADDFFGRGGQVSSGY
ncbi:MAG: S8 family serine peptidase, partial [Chromatiales bacterium]|nr:S8 family serine peptidase [Chromatiales bacterium]